MAKTNANHLVSTAKVFSENKYSEFTTFFRVPFKKGDIIEFVNTTTCYKKIFTTWSDVCIRALEARMDSCVSMLFRNRNNIVISDECQVIFKKANGQYYAFNHSSFKAMEDMKKYLENHEWEHTWPKPIWVQQLLKALYWIPEEDKQEKDSCSFGQLISCLNDFTFEILNK